MASPAKKPCDKCSGTGTVLRERRKLEDGKTPDPLDTRRHELCDRCGGSGVVPQDYAGVQERAASLVTPRGVPLTFGELRRLVPPWL